MSNAWSHLPNAALIDRVLVSANCESDKWCQAWDQTFSVGAIVDGLMMAAMDRAKDEVKDTDRDVNRNELWMAINVGVQMISNTTARTAARCVIIALVAWDDCAYLLDTDPEKVQTLALIGHPAAALLLPSVYAFQKEKALG